MKSGQEKKAKKSSSSSSRNNDNEESATQRKKAAATSRKHAAVATATSASSTKQQPKKNKANGTSNSKAKKKKKKNGRHYHNHHHEPPFDLYKKDPLNPSFAQGFASIISILQQCKRIVVLSGAGISVSCGIPDFRTHGSGLYSTLDYDAYGLSCAEELFDWDVFQDNPVPFFKFARHLYFPLLHNTTITTATATPTPNNGGGVAASNMDEGATATVVAASAAATVEPSPPSPQPQRARPSDSHKLLAILEQKKKLLRVYSQNIDGLEQQAGVSAKKVVYAHGSLQWATCCKCKRKVSAQEMEADILAGNVAYCQAPIIVPTNHTTTNINDSNHNNTDDTADTLPTVQSSRESSTRNRSNKRPRTQSITTEGSNNNNSTNASVCGGVLKPGVTFFGEPLKDTVGKCLEADRDKVDALIVIGTSLSVAPISKVIHFLPPNIPRILINRTIVHPEPKHQQQQQAQNSTSSDDDDNEEEEEDFRDDYVFDAYLLGYCDDVTRALAKHLFASPDVTPPPEIEVGRLVANLVENNKNQTNKLKENESHNNDDEEVIDEEEEEDEDDDDDEEDSPYNAQDWASITVPKNRVFLFPGATPHNDLALSSSHHDGDSNTAESPPRFCEIAHCDACAKRIVGMIQKCVTCFDYDLCPDCYPTISKTHHEGKHVFCAEPAAPLVPPGGER